MKNLILPVGVLAIFASMLLPLPAFLLDIMLVANLILSLLLLVSALYITKPLKLSSLPTLLLLATLFRLALNVSTTRMILGSSEISKTIEAFGKVVIQGNLTVGVVVFLVITLVQFIVIAKGSERVAEVSARFTLDALPGKQMSIDADVRAGLIDFKTAKEKREELQTESRFYGALDGAMKFVKGDAIAGLVITLINILGGFAVGIFMFDLDFSTALSKYTLLTVGDGLLAQIPAFLNSLSAGMIITRVSDGQKSLALQIPEQLGQLKEAKIIITVLALLLAVLPGMPAIPFLIVSCVFFLSYAMGMKNIPVAQNVVEEKKFIPKISPVLSFEFNQAFLRQLSNINVLKNHMEDFRRYCFEKWGILLMPPTLLPNSNIKTFIAKIKGMEVKVKNDITFEDGGVNFSKSLREMFDNNKLEFIDDSHTKRLLDFYETSYQDLVNRVVPDIVSVTKLTIILKNLLQEDISIRHFDSILQAIAQTEKEKLDDKNLLASVRAYLKREISLKYSKDFSMDVLLLDPAIDLEFMKASKEVDIVSDESYSSILNYCKENLEDEKVVLLTSKEARFGVHEFLSMQGINIPVLSHDEIIKDIKYNIKGSIAKGIVGAIV